MAFTTEPVDVTPIGTQTNLPNQFDLPSKEYSSFDPNTAKKPQENQEAGANVSQPNTAEGQVDDTTPARPEETIALSPKLTALARKEQAQRRRESEFAQREKSLADRLAKADRFDDLQSKLAKKDFSAAEELGMTYEQYTEYLLKKQASEDPGEQRYRNVESKLEQLQKAQEEQTVQEYQANQKLWKQEIAKTIEDNADFSTIKELGLQHIVLKHINDSFDEDGVELTVDQAAKEIEDAVIARAEKFASVSKIKKKFEEAPKTLGPPKTSPKTITQNMTVTSEKPKSKPFHMLSEREQWEEAARQVQAKRLAQFR